MDQRIINLYDHFTHGGMNRRDFLDRLAGLAGSAAAGAALLPLLQNNYAQAAIVAADDARLEAERVSYDSPKGKINGYLVRAKAKGKRPAIVVIHENRGLNPHAEDVARRLALAGYTAVGVDMLSPQGGTPTDEDKARDMFTRVDRNVAVADLVAVADWLLARPDANGKVGAVGFCWGGGMVNALATAAPKLNAAVPFYGNVPASADVPKIKAKMLMHYAGNDPRINAGIPDFEAALKTAGVDYRYYVYDGAEHAFNNDTAGVRYNEAAAKLAWGRTLEFFKATLG